MTNIHACAMADARTMVAPFVAMDIPKASQLVPAVGPMSALSLRSPTLPLGFLNRAKRIRFEPRQTGI